MLSVMNPNMTPGDYLKISLCHCFLVWGSTVVSDKLMAASWNQFRGPTGQGITSAKSIPTQWDDQKNVSWKTPIHDRGWSSPIIQNGNVWLTTATEDGKQLFVMAIDAVSGAVFIDRQLFAVETPQFAHKFNSYASPTPVADEHHVFLTFGSPGTACLDGTTGNVVWERKDIECNHFRGAGSSPILYENLLIMNFDGSDHQYIIALDKATGETRWRTQRSIDYMDLDPNGKPEADGDWRKGFSTPHVAFFNGSPTLLSIGSKALYGYVPLTGKELWRTESRMGHSASTRPTVTDDMIYYCTGFSKGELWAVKPEGRGNVTDTHVSWQLKRSVPNKPSLVYKDGHIYMIHDGGVASCIEAESGKPVWQERIGGNYSASPILWNDLIYFFSEEGKTTIVKASETFEIVRINELGSGFMASPAVIDQALILRSKTHLYRIQD